MNVAVVLKQVPDLVEELEVRPDGRGLDRDWLKFKLNEFDEHALEEALLLKEALGGTVTVFGIEAPDVDESLYTALAKGADAAVKVAGDFPEGVTSHQAARLLAGALAGRDVQLVLTGVQAADDLDGQVGPLLARELGWPCVTVVSGVRVEDGRVVVTKEFTGGVTAELEVSLPAVLGIQAASQPPRYAPVSRVRQVMRTVSLEEVAAGDPGEPGLAVRRLAPPPAGRKAERIEGTPQEVAERIAAILRERGLLKR